MRNECSDRILVFDIETIPDLALARQRFGLEDLADQQVYQALTHQFSTGFPPHPYHQVVAISVVLHDPNRLRVWSLGDLQSTEKEMIQRFFEGVEQHVPTLVSWNGSGFDLPVLHYRALKHALVAPRYWEMGDSDPSFKWNNYMNRFHWRHLDLMDVLSGYQGKAIAKLDLIAELLGFPGKLGMDGSKVWSAYQQGELQAIRDYCETDVMNTYLIYLRFERMRGNLSEELHAAYEDRLRVLLSAGQKKHGIEFLNAWAKQDEKVGFASND